MQLKKWPIMAATGEKMKIIKAKTVEKIADRMLNVMVIAMILCLPVGIAVLAITQAPAIPMEDNAAIFITCGLFISLTIIVSVRAEAGRIADQSR